MGIPEVTSSTNVVKKPTTGSPFKSNNVAKYYNIVREMAITDFRLKYHDSALGYIWTMLNPLLMFGVYYFVFTKIFPSKIPNYPLFLLIGIFTYAFFQDCTFSAMNALAGKAGIMKKIYFPKTIIIIASSSTCTFSFIINLTALIVLIVFVKGISFWVFLLPIAILCMILFSTGIGFFLGAMYAYFRDMAQIWGVVVLVLFWLSPIVFDVETLPEQISTFVYLNPLTRILGLMRHYLLYDFFDLRFLLMTIFYSLLSLLIGYFFFKKHEHKLSELF